MVDLVHRACPVCDADAPQPLHQRGFAALPGLPELRGHGFTQRLVACGRCGAQYVQAHLSDDDLARYYASMSSYEYLESAADFPAEERLRTERQLAFLAPYLGRHAAPPQVLDVGCSIGYTLHRLAAQGCAVRGVEPSATLAAIARQRYGLAVDTGFVGAGSTLPAGQQLVLLSHVLEHLRHPAQMLAAIRHCLADDGLLFIEVPAIELFDERDLFQLSFEHLNYFSHGSLSNLLHACGFAAVDHVVFENDDGSSPHYPTLGTLWQRSAQRWPLVPRGAHDTPVMRRYLALVARHADALDQRLDALLAGDDAVLLWGAGTLSAQLLANTALARARGRIPAILDIDPKKQGQQLEGIPVHHPDSGAGQALLAGPARIVIGSWSSQEAIHQGLRQRGIAEPRIVRLFA